MQQQAANVYEIRLIPALIFNLNATTCWLTKDTLLLQIDVGFYQSWSGFLALKVQTHLKKTEPTIFGHQKLI